MLCNDDGMRASHMAYKDNNWCNVTKQHGTNNYIMVTNEKPHNDSNYIKSKLNSQTPDEQMAVFRKECTTWLAGPLWCGMGVCT